MHDSIRLDVESWYDLGVALLDAADLLESGEAIKLRFFMRRTFVGSATVTAGKLEPAEQARGGRTSAELPESEVTYLVDLSLYPGGEDVEAVTLSFEHDGHNPPAIFEREEVSAAQFFQSGARFPKARAA